MNEAYGDGEIGTPDSSHIPKDIFSWPLSSGFSITSGFGYRKDPFTGETSYHSGIDVGAPEGTPILAAADGTVIVANSSDSWGGGYGNYVKIQHNDTYSTTYAHCSHIAVTNGQTVKKGQVIAYVGTTGNSTGNHLHWEVWKDGNGDNRRNSRHHPYAQDETRPLFNCFSFRFSSDCAVRSFFHHNSFACFGKRGSDLYSVRIADNHSCCKKR
ncbi:MAG: M23 family metallopeptidase [Oscillospiraceae bacterium]|nr:M23 family metallopeptidase [Oscillospiraceae bacterium]